MTANQFASGESGESSLPKKQHELNLLLIDDSKSTLLKHQEILKVALPKAKIKAFAEASQALDYLEKTNSMKPDIVFFDILMPEIDGFQFMDKFLDRFANLTHQNSPLMVLVSENLSLNNFNTSKDYKMLGLQIDHIRKPLTESDVMDIIEEHFEL